jgi:hypothetical protein
MIHDMNFKVIEKRNGLFPNEKPYHTYIFVRNGLYTYSPQDDREYDCIEFEVDYIHESDSIGIIFQYYGIAVANRVVSCRISKETALFLRESFPNELLVPAEAGPNIMAWYSDVCSDELKTMIELMRN